MRLFKPNVQKLQRKKNVPSLIKALADKESEVRKAAASALGEIKDVLAVEPLIAALKDSNSYVRKAAAEALEKVGLPADASVQAWHTVAKQDWHNAVKMGAMAVEPLIAALKDNDGHVRTAAAEALGEIKDALAVEPLIAALNDPYKEVLVATAEALGKIGDMRALYPLINALKLDNWKVQATAAKALGNIGHPEAVEPLIVALIKDDYPSEVIEALGKIGDPRAVEPLLIALEKTGIGCITMNAADALGKIGDTRAVEPLVDLLEGDHHSDDRRHAAMALVEMDHGGKLDAKTKKRILALRKQIYHAHHDVPNQCGFTGAHSDIAEVKL